MNEERLRSKEKLRRVSVDYTTFAGLSPGAKHWYVDIREEDDAVWNEDRQSWVTPSDRRGLIGNRFSNSDFKALAHARKWAEMIVEENFSETHEVTWEEDTGNLERYKLPEPGRY